MYRHSVRIDRRKCVGCTNCIKTCPTEAIRVQQGKAKMMDERCIDCGRCLSACPHHAMVSVTTPVSALGTFKYNIVIPSTTLYSQFKGLEDLEDIYAGLYAMGFDAIYEEAKAVEIFSEAISRYIHSSDAIYPVIPCACPVVPRLITAMYPNLIDNLAPFVAPNEIAARVAKEEFCEAVGVTRNEVGAYYISACAAEMTQIKTRWGSQKVKLTGFCRLGMYLQPCEAMLEKRSQPKKDRVPRRSVWLGRRRYRRHQFSRGHRTSSCGGWNLQYHTMLG